MRTELILPLDLRPHWSQALLQSSETTACPSLAVGRLVKDLGLAQQQSQQDKCGNLCRNIGFRSAEGKRVALWPDAALLRQLKILV